jgi:hypothetical protein
MFKPAGTFVLVCAALFAVASLASSCIELNLPSGDSLFPAPSFIIAGVMDLDPQQPLCSRFVADNGVVYHLFQGPRLSNDEYDQLFEEGARLRLEIQIRDDLVLLCQEGELVEVVEVLEFVPAGET